MAEIWTSPYRAISDETWQRAHDCAVKQFESYVRNDELKTPEQRSKALDDALQHAVGIISMAATK